MASWRPFSEAVLLGQSGTFARGVKPPSEPPRLDRAQGEADTARAWSCAMGTGLIAPADHLPGRADSEDLVAADCPGNDHLETPCVRQPHQHPDGPADSRLDV